MTETDIQREILEYLTYRPEIEFIRRYNSGKVKISQGGKSRWFRPVYAAKGVEFKQLDLMGMLKDGRIIEIEVKVPGKVPDDEQWKEINRVNRIGGIAFWADSVEMAAEQMDIALQQIPDRFLL